MQRARACVQHTGLSCDSMIAQGVPSHTIVDLAGKRAVDLIIMGTHGRTGLSSVLLGSVAEKVVRLAPCPVLVTRRAPETPAVAADTPPAHP
jgi:nucleotide-binding universal stress UspA family protein